MNSESGASTHKSCDRGDIDHMSGFSFAEMRHSCTNYIQHAEYIDFEILTGFLVAEFFQGADLSISGIIYQYIDGPPFTDGFPYGFRYTCFIHQINLQG